MWNISRLSEISKTYKVVSFDIFDTLIKRNAGKPTTVFDYVEAEYNNNHSDDPINGFREKRVEAERKARESKHDSEVTLEEIYSYLSVPQIQELKRLEEEIEVNCCMPNKPVVDQFNLIRENGQRIILISDMYLPEETILRMLRKCGIEQFEKLYLSCEIGKKKKTGELFTYAINDLGVHSKDILHVGDSKTSDNIVPRKLGMTSFYIPRYLKNTEFLSREDIAGAKTPLFPFINNHLPYYADKSVAYKWGYEAFGPLLLGFCSWVYENIRKNRIEKVYLLARDMYLVRQIYEKYFSSEDIKYLEVSRRSLRRTYVRKKGSVLAALDTMTRKPYSLEYLLSVLDIPEDDIESLKKDYDLSTVVALNVDAPSWFAHFNSQVIHILNDENDNAAMYLQQFGLYKDSSMAIVDIGWHGTIQNILEEITGHSFLGLYLGISKRSYFKSMKMDGYWFSYQDEAESFRNISLISILETMLFAQVGTTIGYRKQNNTVMPIYNKCEMTDFSFVGDFQSGAMQFADDYIASYGCDIHIKSEDAMLAFSRMALSPKSEQVRVLGELPYEEEKIFHLVEKRKKYEYILKPLAVIKDYDNSRWKSGYIKWLFPFIKEPNNIEVLIRSRRNRKPH